MEHVLLCDRVLAGHVPEVVDHGIADVVYRREGDAVVYVPQAVGLLPAGDVHVVLGAVDDNQVPGADGAVSHVREQDAVAQVRRHDGVAHWVVIDGGRLHEDADFAGDVVDPHDVGVLLFRPLHGEPCLEFLGEHPRDDVGMADRLVEFDAVPVVQVAAHVAQGHAEPLARVVVVRDDGTAEGLT